MKIVWLLPMLLVASGAFAQSARFGSSMVSVGDVLARVRDVAGSPEKVEPVEGAEPPAEIWIYRRKGRVIHIWISESRVVRVVDRKADASGN